MSGRLDRDYFERIYAESDDPWSFESAWYERRKQALTMALLTKQHYENVFEPGCASGELTRLLSQRAGHVLAQELMPRIASRAKERLADLSNVDVVAGAIPDDWPDQPFDLILLSEVVYYVDAGGVSQIARLIEQTLVPNGDLVCIHYLGDTDYPLSGRQVHDQLQAELEYTTLATYTEHDFAALVMQR